MTLGDLLKESEKHPIVLGGSIDIALTLRADGTFVYLGPLKMGDDPTEVSGRWSVEGSNVTLLLDAPRVSGKETIAQVIAPFKKGLISYPMGRERTLVYYSLVSTMAPAGTTGGIQVGGG